MKSLKKLLVAVALVLALCAGALTVTGCTAGPEAQAVAAKMEAQAAELEAQLKLVDERLVAAEEAQAKAAVRDPELDELIAALKGKAGSLAGGVQQLKQAAAHTAETGQVDWLGLLTGGWAIVSTVAGVGFLSSGSKWARLAKALMDGVQAVSDKALAAKPGEGPATVTVEELKASLKLTSTAAGTQGKLEQELKAKGY